MSAAQKKMFDKQIQDIRAAEKSAGNPRDAALLHEKARQMEVQSARDILQQRVLEGKAIQTSGGALRLPEGRRRVAAGQGTDVESDIAETVGGALGMDGAAMATFSGIAGGAAVILLALDQGLKASAKNMGDAATASFQLGDGLSQQQKVSSQFQDALQKATSWTGGYGRQQLIEFSDVMGQEMGGSGEGGIVDSVMFAKNVAAVGSTFGVSGEEAVKLGTRLGVLSRSDLRGTGRLFTFLGEEAALLSVNMEHLAQPMAQIASMAGAAGAGAESRGGPAMDMVVGAANNLSKVGGPLANVFRTMNAADKTNMVGKFADQFSKISDIQWMAYSMKPGENAQHAFERVENAGPAGRIDYINSLKKKIGFDRMVKNQGLDFAREAMGSIVSGGAFSPFSKEALQSGTMFDLVSQGKRKNSQTTEQILGSALQAKMDQRASLGEFIAGGGDVMQWIANDIAKILALLNQWNSGWMAEGRVRHRHHRIRWPRQR